MYFGAQLSRGPIVHIFEVDNCALDSWAPGQLGPGQLVSRTVGPHCPGPNCPGPNCLGPNLPRTVFTWSHRRPPLPLVSVAVPAVPPPGFKIIRLLHKRPHSSLQTFTMNKGMVLSVLVHFQICIIQQRTNIFKCCTFLSCCNLSSCI